MSEMNTSQITGKPQITQQVPKVVTDIMRDKNLKPKTDETSDKVYRINMCMDAGTSEDRSMLILNRRMTSRDIVISPNKVGQIDINANLKAYTSRSGALYDNLDMTFEELEKENKDGEIIFPEPVRVLYGSLLDQVGVGSQVPNHNAKTSQSILYKNIMSCVLIQCYIAHCKGNPINNVALNFGIVLPPMEVYSNQLDFFTNKIKGTYRLTLNRLNYTVTVKIDKVTVKSEGEVAYPYYISSGANAREKLAEYANKLVVIYDIGAGTNNLSVIKNGEIIDDWMDTYKHAGNSLIGYFGKLCARAFGGSRYPKDTILKAIQTCKLDENTIVRDVQAQVIEAKKRLADDNYTDLMEFLQTNGIETSAIYSIMWLGKTTKSSGTKGVNEVPSVAFYVMNKLAESTPNIKTVLLSGVDNPNLLGLALVMQYS